MKTLKRPKNNRGVALLIAITMIMIIAFLSVELSYDSASEYLIANQEVNRLKARYAAKAGVEISLLRINIYKMAATQFKGVDSRLLDQIWSQPFIWPPVLPSEAGGVDKSNMNEILNESYMDASYTTRISSEGSKLDITDLVSPSKILRDTTKEALLRILENRMQQDDDFAKRNRDTRISELVNNITDWMDTDSASLNSGEESNYYSSLPDSHLPPNQAFKTLDELHMVAGMTDELFDFLAPQITVYGVKAIQVNHASKEVLMGLSPAFNDEISTKIIERIEGRDGPFKDEKEFDTFVSGLGVNFQKAKESFPPLMFESEYNFRVQSIGSFGRTSSEIIAIVYDFDKVKEKLTDSLKNDSKQQTQPSDQQSKDGSSNPGGQPPGNQQGQPQTPNQEQSQPKGRPSIVYWTES